MKKLIFIFAAAILLIFTGCEKEKDTDLSEYLIGGWLTPTMYSEYATGPCHYELLIKEDMLFSIMRKEDGFSTGLSNWPYTVDEAKGTITIITVDGNINEITYDITLTDDPDTMIWTTEQSGGETFLWQRGEVSIPELGVESGTKNQEPILR